MAGLSSTKEQQSIEHFLDEHGEELEQVVSDEEPDQNVNEESTTMDKNTNLHFSAALGKIDALFEDLESPDQRIDAENFMGWTPLMMAVRNGHIEVVKILLEKGADITKKNKLGVNTFNLSIANGNLELMEIVLRHMLKGGISRNRIQENLSPISLAIIFKRTHLLRYLMSQGFNLNATTWKTGLTPLMFAAAASIEKIIPVLEVKGANKNAKNYMGVNYQEIIQWRRHGLENMRVSTRLTQPKLTLPPIAVRTTQPEEEQVLSTTPIINVTIPVDEKLASPITPEGEKKKVVDDDKSERNSLQAKNFVPQVVAVAQKTTLNTENKFSDENDPNLVNQTDVQMPPPNVTTRPYYGGHPRQKRDRRNIHPPSLNLKGESPIVQQSCQFQSPYNMACPFYMPMVNSPYGSPMPSPVTPVMMPPTYQNFMATVADAPQNSPMGFVAHNPYQYGSPVPPVYVHSPMARPDMAYPFDANVVGHSPSAYQGNPFFFPVYPQMQNVYPSSGPTS